jgi:cell wall-associated NlpC family hydrolase
MSSVRAAVAWNLGARVDPDRVQQVKREAAAAGGVDVRRVFTRMDINDAGVVDIESTDAAALARFIEVWQHAGLEARGRHVPPMPGRAAWVLASVAEVRREPSHTEEQVTQALQGEVLVPFLHEDGWLLVRLPDGYEGWVRDWHLSLVDVAAPAAYRRRADARIAASRVTLRTAPHHDAEAVGESILGTHVVRLGDERGWSRIELPGGRAGWVPQPALRAGTADWPCEPDSILAMVRRFLGVPYLWGGRSPKGFDCSGLVQFVFGLHGIPLPRDSDQQAECGTPVEVPAPGDLVFFGRDRVTHVAVAASPDFFLHARGEVRCNATAAGTPLHDAELWALRRGFRRVLPPASAAPPG